MVSVQLAHMHLVKNIGPAAVPQIDASIGSSGGGSKARSCGRMWLECC